VEETGGSEDSIGGGHINEAPGNVEGMLYGVPSFLVGRVLDEETGAPVENALVIILGKGYLALAKTGTGGWFTKEEDLQSPGTYTIAVLKLGYHMELQLTDYQDEPQEVTVLLNKR
jgi:hypothetical protein